MDTSKIKTNIIVPTDEEIKDDKIKEKRSLIWSYVWKILLLVITVVVMIRVPYVGSYIDGLLDYVFGMGKYVLYALLIFVQISIIFHLPTEKVIKSKKFIIISCVGMLAVCCIISGITDTIKYWVSKPAFADVMSKYHAEWKSYFLNPFYHPHFCNVGFISGGILAVLISYLFNYVSYIVLCVIALIVLFCCIFSACNINYRTTKIGLKLRKWMIKKLGGTFNYDGFNELKDIKDNQNKFKKTSKTDIVATAKTSDTLSFDLLPQSDVMCFNQNFKVAGNVQEKIKEFFKKHDIEAVPSELNIYSTFSELCFDAKDSTTVNKVIEVGNELAESVKLESFNLSIRGHVIAFEIPNSYFTKTSLRSALELMGDVADMTAVFALDKKSKAYSQDFRNQPSALILGEKGSGSATLAVLMALSICYVTKPDDLELRVLSANAELTYSSFNRLPHTGGQIYDELPMCVQQIHELQKIVNKRLGLFKSLDVKSVEQYNALCPNSKIKNILVLASNFENIIKESFQNNKVFNDLLVNGPKVGVYVILQSYHVGIEAVDEHIFDACAQKYILRLETDGESERIFKSQRGCQLHGLGDCLTFTKSIRQMIRIQVCNINQTELIQDIDVIKTFYDTKNKNKPDDQPEVLSPTDELKEKPVEEKKEEEEPKEDKPKTSTKKISKTKEIVEEKKEEEPKEDKPKTSTKKISKTKEIVEEKKEEEPKEDKPKTSTKKISKTKEVVEEKKDEDELDFDQLNRFFEDDNESKEDKPKTSTKKIPKTKEIVEEKKEEKPKTSTKKIPKSNDEKNDSKIVEEITKSFTPFRFEPSQPEEDDDEKK